MNGRAYDYNLGRFLSVDPFIQAPDNSQSMNPYSYIMNNPLSGTDPSGYIAIVPVVMWAATAWGAAETAEAAGEMAAKYELDEIDGKELAKGVAMSAVENTVGKKIKIAKTLTVKARQAVTGSKPEALNNKTPKGDNGKNTEHREKTSNSEKPEHIGSNNENAKNFKGKQSRQQRLTDLKDDAKVSSADRGWIKQEKNEVSRGKKKHLRNPPGKDLAHERGRENAKGYGYEHANLQNKKDHKTQHKFDDYGKKNKERPLKKN